MTEAQFHAAAVREFIDNPLSLGPELIRGGTTEPESDYVSAAFPLTDLGNSERLVKRHGSEIRYCHISNAWLYWDGKRWRQDDTGEINRLAVETARSLYQEAAMCDDLEMRPKLAKHATNSEKRERLRAMVDLAKDHRDVVVRPEEFDSDPMLLNVRNGTVNLHNGKRQPHDRANLISKTADVDYDENAPAPVFDAFIDRTFNGDRKLISFVMRALGYGLTGSTDEQVMFLFHGAGANGKSTLLAIVQEVMGDYAMTAPASLLLARKDDDKAFNDLERLRGARFVAMSELEDGQRLAEARVKSITGGDRVVARRLYSHQFSYVPQFKLCLGLNHLPVIRGVDLGMWRRIRLIPFNVVIPEDERDPKLLEKLRAESSGILARLVRGCLEWQERGLDPPEAVLAATAQYRSDSDQLARFLEDRCIQSDGFTIGAAQLYSVYRAWCERCGEPAITSTAFGLRLRDRSVEKRRTNRGMIYEGIRLNEE